MKKRNLVFVVIAFSVFAGLVWGCASDLFQTDTVGYMPPIGAIVIDAGHGGKDPGMTKVLSNGERVKEKDFSLSIALLLAQEYRAAFPDMQVILTRDKDIYIPMTERVKTGTDVNATLFVSLHLNGSLNTSARGFELWYNNMASYPFALSVLNNLTSTIGGASPSRGVRDQNWYMPPIGAARAVLIECGFLSNEDEASLLATQSYQQLIAEGILAAIKEFTGSDTR